MYTQIWLNFETVAAYLSESSILKFIVKNLFFFLPVGGAQQLQINHINQIDSSAMLVFSIYVLIHNK